MKTIMLYGHLGEEHGRVHRLDVKTPAEAIHALCVTRPGFRSTLLRNQKQGSGYRIVVGGRPAKKDDLLLPCGETETIRVVPATCGAGGEDTQIFIGAVLVVIGNAFPAFEFLTPIGLAMIAGGVAQAMADTPVVAPQEDPANQPSYVFNGPVNTTAQGNPVPICYGKMLVGSQVISAGLSVEQL